MLRLLGILPEKKVAQRKAASAVSKPATRPVSRVKALPATVIPKDAKPNAEGLYLHRGDEPPVGAAIIVWGTVGEGEFYWRPEDASAASVVARPAHNRDAETAKTSRDRWAYRHPTMAFAFELAGHHMRWKALRKAHPTAHNDDLIATIAREFKQKDFYVKRSLATFPKFENWVQDNGWRHIWPDGFDESDYSDVCHWKRVWLSPQEFSKRSGLVYSTGGAHRYIVHWRDGIWLYRMTSVVEQPGPHHGMIWGNRVQAAKPPQTREDEKLEARLEAIRDARPSGRR